MAPDKPVVIHEPFRIQYIVDEAIAESEFIAPDWNGLTIVTAKQVNNGFFQTQKGKTAIKNIIYTLAATNTGVKLIQPATIIQGKQMYRCNPVTLNIVAAGGSDLPISTPKNINNKLYLKLHITKNTCYVGESVLATYKLYSAITTQTDITKNPEFIGFSAVNALSMHVTPAEHQTINGIKYEVHTLVKSLLFPLQEGSYTVDKMEVNSKVFPEGNGGGHTAADSFEVSAASNTAGVQVKALPNLDNNDNYYGGVGNFKLKAYWSKNGFRRNETGKLVVRLEGTGNFTQITAPEFNWPEGLNVFSPEIKDSFNVTANGLLIGARSFIYPFNATKSGIFLPDTVQFTYFDPAQKKYITLKTRPDIVNVSNEKYTHESKKIVGTSNMWQGAYTKWLLAGIFIVMAILLVWGLFKRRKTNDKDSGNIEENQYEPIIPDSAVSISLPLVIEQQGKAFYTILKQQVLQVVSDKMRVRLNAINTIEGLKKAVMPQAGNTIAIFLANIITTCNEKIYAPETTDNDTAILLQQANSALEKLVEIVPAEGK